MNDDRVQWDKFKLVTRFQPRVARNVRKATIKDAYFVAPWPKGMDEHQKTLPR